MKRKLIIISIILALVITATIAGFTMTTNAATGFKVNGTSLLDANGNAFVMKGVNHAHTWYKDQLNVAVPAISKLGANTIRIGLSNGGQWTKDTASDVANVIKVCEDNKLVAILEVHDATGYNDIASLLKAAEYFAEIKSALQGHENTVIINIANEWAGEWQTANWATGYKQAIPIIRNAGLTHAILVDGAGYGQYPQSIMDAGKEVLAADTQKNTFFAWHGYEYAAGTQADIKKNIDGVLAQGLCLVIGEFGFKHTSGDVDEAYLISYANSNKVGWLAWSWKGNSGGVEYLDLSNDWAGTNLSDWGKTIANALSGTPKCSVFSGTSPVQTSSATSPSASIVRTTSSAPSPSPSVVRTTSVVSPSPSQQTATGVTATVSITNEWGTGGQAKVIIKNNGTTATSSWSVTVNIPGIISNIWCAKGSGSGNVTLTNESWNGTIPAGGSIEAGIVFTK